MDHTFTRVVAMMEDGGVDVMILTEVKVRFRTKGAVMAAAGRADIFCVVATPPEGTGAAGASVLVVWRPGMNMSRTRMTTHAGGRAVSIRFMRRTCGRRQALELIGLYGVSNPHARRSEADELWKWAAERVRQARVSAGAHGRSTEIIVGGDMNAVMDPVTERGAFARDRREGADPGLACFLRQTALRDAAECWGGGAGEGARDFTFNADWEGGGTSRLDKFYVSKNLTGRVTGSGGRTREVHMFTGMEAGEPKYATDHPQAWMDMVGFIGDGQTGPRKSGGSRPFRTNGGTHARKGGQGYPVAVTEDVVGHGTPPSHKRARAWMEAGGYRTDMLSPSHRVGDGTKAAEMIDGWVEGGMPRGMAEESECSLLLFPLFEGAGYERAIERVGGQIVFRASPGTWSFIPDRYWERRGGDRRGSYLEDHEMAVVAVGRGVTNGAEGVRLAAVKRTLHAWWASRAPEGEPGQNQTFPFFHF
jgi:hypothetical protein